MTPARRAKIVEESVKASWSPIGPDSDLTTCSIGSIKAIAKLAVLRALSLADDARSTRPLPMPTPEHLHLIHEMVRNIAKDDGGRDPKPMDVVIATLHWLEELGAGKIVRPAHWPDDARTATMGLTPEQVEVIFTAVYEEYVVRVNSQEKTEKVAARMSIRAAIDATVERLGGGG